MKAVKTFAGIACLLLAGLFMSCDKLYNVTYDRNGHGTNPKSTMFWGKSGLEEDNLPICEDDTWYFEYWYLKDDETQSKVAVGDRFQQDITLVAKWDETVHRTSKIEFKLPEDDDAQAKNSNGEYDGKKFYVTLSTEDDWAKIHYKINGNVERTVDSPYNLALPAGTNTVSAYTTSTGKHESLTKTEIYKIDGGVSKATNLTVERGDADTECILRWKLPSDADLKYMGIIQSVDGVKTYIGGNVLIDAETGEKVYSKDKFMEALKVTDLTLGKTYQFTIAVFDEFSNFANSDTVSYAAIDTSVPHVATITATTSNAAGSNGAYKAGTTVALATETSGATIYYTMDGSEPTTSSSVYSAPIALPAGTTIVKAVGVSAGMENSAVFSASYTVDAVAPEVVSDLDASFTGTSVLVTWTNPKDEDLASVELKYVKAGTVDYRTIVSLPNSETGLVKGGDAQYEVATGSADNALSVGSWYFKVVATDLTGNTSESAECMVMVNDTGAAGILIY